MRRNSVPARPYSKAVAAPGNARQELKARGIDPLEREHLLEEVQLRLGEIDELKLRVGELEERLDFTERLLAKPREGLSLGPPREE